jgi:cell division protein FtsN
MAKRRQRRRSAPRKKKQEFPGWAYGLFGLAVGLSVAAAVWVNKQSPAGTRPAIRQPASLDAALDDSSRRPRSDSVAPAKKNRFDFYEMLPNFEVIVPEEDPEVAADAGLNAIAQPGIYVLQAGSFTAYADADRRRAELALQGITSKIQKVIIDDKTYHRVRIGPIENLDELNLLRNRLRAAKIDVLRIRLGE